MHIDVAYRQHGKQQSVQWCELSSFRNLPHNDVTTQSEQILNFEYGNEWEQHTEDKNCDKWQYYWTGNRF